MLVVEELHQRNGGAPRRADQGLVVRGGEGAGLAQVRDDAHAQGVDGVAVEPEVARGPDQRALALEVSEEVAQRGGVGAELRAPVAQGRRLECGLPSVFDDAPTQGLLLLKLVS